MVCKTCWRILPGNFASKVCSLFMTEFMGKKHRSLLHHTPYAALSQARGQFLAVLHVTGIR